MLHEQRDECNVITPRGQMSLFDFMDLVKEEARKKREADEEEENAPPLKWHAKPWTGNVMDAVEDLSQHVDDMEAETKCALCGRLVESPSHNENVDGSVRRLGCGHITHVSCLALVLEKSVVLRVWRVNNSSMVPLSFNCSSCGNVYSSTRSGADKKDGEIAMTKLRSM